MYEVIEEICGHDWAACIYEAIAQILAFCEVAADKTGGSIKGQINEAKERIERGAVQVCEYPLDEQMQARRRKAL